MDFRVLGPVEAWDQGAVCRLRPRSTELLAHFLVRRNRALTRDALIDQLWPHGAPASAVGSLNVHLHRLRHELSREGAVSRLATSAFGYTLVVEDGELDSDRFTRHVEQARQTWTHQPARAVAELDAALTLWRERPYAGIDDHEAVGVARASLEALHHDAHCVLADALLRVGDHGRIVAEAPGWLAAHPYSEHLAGRLALAMYGRGDQVKALRWCREFGQRLADELGLDPSPAFRGIEVEILDHAVAPAVTCSAAPVHVAAVAPPALVERDEAMSAAIDALLGGPGSGVVAISGEAGAGKTALLLALADQVPGSAVIVGRKDHPLAAVMALAAELAPDASPPPDRQPDALTLWLIRLLEQRGRPAVLWDDVHAADPDSVAVLQRVARRTPLRWLTTSRSADLDDHPLLSDRSLLAHTTAIRLPPLTDAGLAALAMRMGAPSEPEDVRKLAAQTGGNPFLAHALLRSPEWRQAGSTPMTAAEHIRRLVADLGDDASAWYVLAALDPPGAVDVHVVSAAASISPIRGAELAEAGLAVGLLRDDGREVAFRHGLVREALTSALSAPRQRLLHERLASVLIALPDAPVARTAHHLRCAHSPALRRHAAEFTARQADEELAAGAPLTSAEHLMEAAELIDPIDAEVAVRWRLDSCDALVLAGRTVDSQDRAAAVAAHARRTHRRDHFVRATRLACGPYLSTGASAERAEALVLESIDWCRADGKALPAALCEAVVRQLTDRADAQARGLREIVRPYLERYSEVGSAEERLLGLIGRRALGWADGISLDDRRRLLTTCVNLAVQAGSLHHELRVRWSLVSDNFVAADSAVDAAVNAYARRAEGAGSPMHRWVSGRLALAVAHTRGRVVEPSSPGARLHEVLSFVDPDAQQRAELLMVLSEAVLSHQLGALAAAADSVDLGDGPEWVPLLELARLAIRHDGGQVIDLLAVSRHLDTGGHGTVRAAACALACLCLAGPGGDHEQMVARRVVEWLTPWAGTMVLLESGFACLGPADAYLAHASLVVGDPDAANYHHRAAAQVTSRFAHAWAGWSVDGG